MWQQVLGWWSAQRRASSLPGAITLVLVIPLALLLMLGSSGRQPYAVGSAELSPQARAVISAWAAETAPRASVFAYFARLRAGDFARTEARDLDETEVWEYARWTERWGGRFVSSYASLIEEFQPVDKPGARAYTRKCLRQLAGHSVATERLTAPCGSPFLPLLFAPSPGVPPGGQTPEEAMTEAIQHLLSVLANLPPNSNGAQGIRNAIIAIRKAIVPFDVTPVAISFIKPTPDVVLAAMPIVTFEITDSGSGPDPASAKLQAVNTGPVVFETTDLAGFLAITLNDQVEGRVVAEASGMPDATLQDGFLRFEASATDHAGSATTTSTLSVVLDRQPPAIAITSPTDGSSLTTTDVPLSVTINDSVSGVDVATLHVVLDGVDITPTLIASSGPPNPLGYPNSVAVAGALSVAVGSHSLEITAKDAAGHMSAASSAFLVLVSGGGGIELLKMAGDGQTLTVNECSTPLQVKAVSLATGLPVPGLTLAWTVPHLGDALSSIDAIGPVTDSAGLASLRYMPRKSGASTVEVGVLADDSIAPVLFSISAELPVLQDVTEAGPCNSAMEIAEYPGSALPRIFKMRVRKTSGAPLPDVTVAPGVVDAAGNLVSPAPGEFLPVSALTNADGVAEFTFLIKSNAPAGPITMRFSIPEFLDESSVPVHVDIGGSVRAEAGPELGRFWKITEGQAQVALPGSAVTNTLKVGNLTSGTFVAAFFFMEGSGSMLPAGGVLEFATADACGNPVLLLRDPSETGGGEVGVNVTLGAGVKRALIGVRPTSPDIFPVMDVFVITGAEVRVVSNPVGGGGVVVKNIVAGMNLQDFASEKLFNIEVIAPNGLTAPPTLDVKARNMCGETLNFENAQAPATLTGLPTSAVQATDRFTVYRTTATLAAVTGRQLAGDPVPTTPAGVSAIQMSELGALEINSSLDPQDPKRRVRAGNMLAGEVAKGSRELFYGNGKDVAFQVEGAELANVEKVKWDFGDGSAELVEVKSKAVKHKFTVEENAGNRRKRFTVKATLLDKDNNTIGTIETPVRIVLSKITGDHPGPGLSGTEAQYQAALDTFKWNEGEDTPATPPTAFAGLSESPFSNLNEQAGMDLIQKKLGTAGISGNKLPAENRRLIFKETISVPSATKATTVFELTSLDFRDYRVYASYGTKALWTFETQELNSIIAHHKKHVRDLFDAKKQNSGTSGRLIRDVYEFYKQKAGVLAFNGIDDSSTAVNINKYDKLLAAWDVGPDGSLIAAGTANPQDYTRVPHAFAEVEPWTDQFTAEGGGTDAEVSNFFMDRAFFQLVIWYNASTNDIAEKLKAAPGNVVLTNAMKHLAAQYKKLIAGFPELESMAEFQKELRLVEPK